jgi:polygalacturonase
MDPTGVVDASPAIQAAIDAAAASGSANCGVQLPPGNATFRCDSPVGLRRGVIVFGDLGG